VDLPSHGNSSGTACSTIEQYSAAVLDDLDARGVKSFAVAGHSMGAMIALDLAASHPQRVTALALIGAGLALGVNPALLDGTRDTPVLAAQAIVDWGHSPDSHLGAAQTPGLWMDGTDLAVMQAEIDSHPGSLHADFSALASFDGTALAASVTCPTLVISGQRDNMTPPKLGKTAAAAIDNCRYLELAGAGHMLMTERPAEVAKELRSFFAQASVTS